MLKNTFTFIIEQKTFKVTNEEESKAKYKEGIFQLILLLQIFFIIFNIQIHSCQNHNTKQTHPQMEKIFFYVFYKFLYFSFFCKTFDGILWTSAVVYILHSANS